MAFLTIRALEITLFLQIGHMTSVADARACPRVVDLMYPSRTCALLSIF
jgi:hypothetical protein